MSLRDFRHHPGLLPFAMSSALGVVTLGWNAHTGLSWSGPTLGTILLASAPLLLLAAHAAVRGMPCFAEAVAFACLYMIVPLVAVRLSYLVTTLNFPLVDPSLAGFDHALGFDRMFWENALDAHPALRHLIFAAYMSPIGQALLSSAIFSYAMPGKRNFEIFFTLIAALLAIIAIYALLPELGPDSLIGRHYQFEANILAVRAGSLGPFPYTGIVSFPSYHTVMAIAFTYGHRGLRSFWPVAGLNALMLLGTPIFGDHYVADMCAGAAIAACAILASRAIYGSTRDELRLGSATPAWNSVAAE